VKLPAHASYKASGIEWLGNLPEHWDVKRLKYVAEILTSGVWGDDPETEGDGWPVATTANISPLGEIDVAGMHIRLLSKEELRKGLCRPGDTIVVKSSGSASSVISGKCAMVRPEHGAICFSNFTLRVRPIDGRLNPFFAWSFLSSGIVRAQVRLMVSTTTYPNLQVPEYISFLVPQPPPDEQQAIAAFLKRETARVDRLVSKKRELIERLTEKRIALISRTVTLGLPPAAARAAGLPENPPLKPSGIEWLGDIPEHWEAAQLRRKAHIFDCKHRTVPFIDEGIPLASIREVHGFEVDLSKANQTSEDEYLALIEGDRRPRVGDIIYSRNATVGDAALVTTSERFCMGQDVCLIRAPKHHAKYLLYLFRSAPLIEQVESLMIGSTFRRINVGQIHAFWICIPPLSEQAAIAAYLDIETARLDSLLQKVEEAVERFQEYRTALVTAAVTGKIDVRKVAA
jgi:type I restriction enzyme, S subunit